MKNPARPVRRKSVSLQLNHNNDNNDAKPSHFTGVIDRELAKQHKVSSTTVRVLLNNTTGEAIFKDILECWGLSLSEDDENMYRILLQSKLLEDTKKLCQQLESLDLVKNLDKDDSSASSSITTDNQTESEESKTSLMTAREAYDELTFVFQQNHKQDAFNGAKQSTSCRTTSSDIVNAKLLLQYAHAIRTLWRSSATEKLFRFQKLHPQWTSPTIPRYASQTVTHISSSSFRPGPHDISGINFPFPVVTKLQLNDLVYEIHDIGGMSSQQRKRLIHCFDQTDILIFVAALSQYDEPVSPRDQKGDGVGDGKGSMNRLAAAIDEFRYFVQSNLVSASTTSTRPRRPIVVLTRKDTFTSKIKYSSLSEQSSFSDFDGSSSEAVEYVVNKFRNWSKDGLIDVSDNEQCRMPFFSEATRRVLVIENLRRSGFLDVTEVENLLKEGGLDLDDD